MPRNMEHTLGTTQGPPSDRQSLLMDKCSCDPLEHSTAVHQWNSVIRAQGSRRVSVSLTLPRFGEWRMQETRGLEAPATLELQTDKELAGFWALKLGSACGCALRVFLLLQKSPRSPLTLTRSPAIHCSQELKGPGHRYGISAGVSAEKGPPHAQGKPSGASFFSLQMRNNHDNIHIFISQALGYLHHPQLEIRHTAARFTGERGHAPHSSPGPCLSGAHWEGRGPPPALLHPQIWSNSESKCLESAQDSLRYKKRMQQLTAVLSLLPYLGTQPPLPNPHLSWYVKELFVCPLDKQIKGL